MFQVQVNNKESISFDEIENQLVIKNYPKDTSLIDLGNLEYHAIVNGQSCRVSIKKVNREDKTVIAAVNGKYCEIKITDKMDALLKNLGLENALAKKINELKAPMPGLVLEVLAKVGDVVKKGTPLLVLEAMKMENSIKAIGDGVVKEIKVSPKDAVDKNQVLITFE